MPDREESTADRNVVRPDVVDVLLAQHAEIERLFRLAGAADGAADGTPDPVAESDGGLADAFDQLVRLLAVHETAEEEVVHPLSRTLDGGQDALVDDRLAEERAAKELLASLIEGGVRAPEFLPGLRQLRLAVLQHARHEERYEFPRLRHEVDAGRLRALATAVKAAEAVAPTRPHAGTESAKANAVLGMPLAVMDRVRDALHSASNSSASNSSASDSGASDGKA